MNTFAERLLYARKLRGYTQDSLAKAIGVSRGVTNNLELGRTDNPQEIVINAICRELAISKDWLVNGNGEMEPPHFTSKSLEVLAQLCSTLSDAEVQYLIEQVLLMQKHNIISQSRSDDK